MNSPAIIMMVVMKYYVIGRRLVYWGHIKSPSSSVVLVLAIENLTNPEIENRTVLTRLSTPDKQP